jgi:uncharacterized small protein (DUF1192 family)
MVLIILVLVLMIPLLAILLDSHLGKALAARIERRPLTSGEEINQERIALLEGEVERLGSELARLEEESQFLHRLLTERAGGTAEGEDRASG